MKILDKTGVVSHYEDLQDETTNVKPAGKLKFVIKNIILPIITGILVMLIFVGFDKLNSMI